WPCAEMEGGRPPFFKRRSSGELRFLVKLFESLFEIGLPLRDAEAIEHRERLVPEFAGLLPLAAGLRDVAEIRDIPGGDFLAARSGKSGREGEAFVVEPLGPFQVAARLGNEREVRDIARQALEISDSAIDLDGLSEKRLGTIQLAAGLRD